MDVPYNKGFAGMLTNRSHHQEPSILNNKLTNIVPPTRHRRSYKPLILRVPCLLFVALLAGGLIGLLEYASRELPHADKGHHEPLDKLKSQIESALRKRDDSTSATVSAATAPLTEIAVPSAYVSTKLVSSSSEPVVAFTAAGSEYVAPVTSTTDDGAYIATGSTLGFAPASNYVSTGVTVAATAASSKYASTQVTISTTQTTISTSSIVTTNSQGQPTTIATVVPITTVKAIATSIPDQSNKGLQRVTVLTWPLWKVFVGGYLPVLTAIIFRIFWNSIYNKVKLIEPFTRLAQPEGAVAADTLHTYYLSTNLTPDPIISFFKGHWLIFWASLVYSVTAVLPALSTEAIFLDTNYQCSNPDLTSHNPCWPPKLSVDPVVVRWLQGLLGYIAIMTLGLMIMLLRSKTGLSHDPSSIAAVAALMHHPEVLEEFRCFSDEAQLKEMRLRLGDRRYKLDDYKLSDGTWRYGIVPVDGPINYHWSDKHNDEKHSGLSNGAKRRRNFDAFYDTLFLLLLLGVEGVLVAYYKSSGNTGFNNFFNSNTFGPRFFMAAMATVISLNWKRLEREVHTLTPYHRLARSPSPARSTILLRKRSLPYTAFFAMLYHKHFFAAIIALTAIFADLLVISLAGVPYSPGQIWLELLVCSYASMAILGIMILSLVALLVWRRKSPDLPRAPDTLMGVMSYVADARMLDDFEGVDGLKSGEVEDRVVGLGKRYGYGRFVGMDGQSRLMVDEEFRLMV
jgi:hypothetical protein